MSATNRWPEGISIRSAHRTSAWLPESTTSWRARPLESTRAVTLVLRHHGCGQWPGVPAHRRDWCRPGGPSHGWRPNGPGRPEAPQRRASIDEPRAHFDSIAATGCKPRTRDRSAEADPSKDRRHGGCRASPRSLAGHPSEDGPGGFCPDSVEGVSEPHPERFRDLASQVCFHWNLIDDNEMRSMYYAASILKTRPRRSPQVLALEDRC